MSLLVHRPPAFNDIVGIVSQMPNSSVSAAIELSTSAVVANTTGFIINIPNINNGNNFNNSVANNNNNNNNGNMPDQNMYQVAQVGLSIMDQYLINTKVWVAHRLWNVSACGEVTVLSLCWLDELLQANYSDSIYGAYVFNGVFLWNGSWQPNDVLTYTILQNTTSLHAAPIFMNVRIDDVAWRRQWRGVV